MCIVTVQQPFVREHFYRHLTVDIIKWPIAALKKLLLLSHTSLDSA